MVVKTVSLPALAVIAGAAFHPAAGQDLVRTIRIISEPAADVCEVSGPELSCLGRSPIELKLEFRSAASARRLHLVRIGYEAARVTVSPDDTEVRTRLRERPVRAGSGGAGASPAEKQVRTFVTSRLRDLLFGPAPPAQLRGFDFLGEVDVNPIESGRFEVIVPIMIEDRFRSQLASVDRSFHPDERPYQVARALWSDYVGALGGVLRDTFSRDARVARVTVAANYSRTRYALVDDDSTFQFSTKMWTGSSTQRYGDVVQRVDHYRVSTFALPTGYTKFAATRRIYLAAFVVPAGGPRSAMPALEDVAVLSNDNRSGQLVEVRK